MTDPVKEQLSACLDGQLPEAELGLLLKQLQRDPALGRSMGNYALIGEAMRGSVAVRASSGFADRIAAALAEEPATNESTSPVPQTSRYGAASGLRWLRPAAGAAIAAGVAAVAVIAMQPVSVEAPQIADTAEPAQQIGPEIAPSYTVPANAGANGSAFIPAARLTNYVVAHSEYSSPLVRRTVLSGVLAEDELSEDEAVQVTGDSVESDPAPEVTGPQR